MCSLPLALTVIQFYKITDSLDCAVEEILNFYNVFHSMRYINDCLVFRLKNRISNQTLKSINIEFSDILSSGKFTIGESLDEENDEPTLKEMPRLIFHFNRRSLGRLRQLVDTLNQTSEFN